MNIFGRYSYRASSTSTARRPSATGGGGELVEPGRQLEGDEPQPGPGRSTTRSIARPSSTSASASSSTGGRAAQRLRHHARARRRHPGPEPRRRLHAPACPSSSSTAATGADAASAPAWTPAAATARWPRTRSSAQIVPTSPSSSGNHTVKFGVDVRRAYNLRVPSDAPPLGRALLQRRAHAGPDGRRPRPGHLPARRRLALPPLRQPQHRRPRAAVAAVLLRAGHLARHPEADPQLRPARRTSSIPQTVNEAGNGGWLDIDTGEIRVGGVGDIDLAGNVKNKINWAPRLGVTYQLNEKTVVRAGLRPQLRHRRVRLHLRPLRDPEPARARVQELNPPNNFDTRVQPGRRARRRPSFPTVPRTAASALPERRLRALPARQAEPAHVDAYNVTVQRELSTYASRPRSPTSATGARAFLRRRPRANANEPTIVGFPERRRATSAGPSSASRSFGWTQGIDFFSNTRQPLQLAAGQAHQALDERLLAAHPLHAAEPQEQRRRLLLHRPRPELRAATSSARTSRPGRHAELPFGKGTTAVLLGGWQLNANATIMSGLPFNVELPRRRPGPRHRPQPAQPDRRSRHRAAATADRSRTST